MIPVDARASQRLLKGILVSCVLAGVRLYARFLRAREETFAVLNWSFLFGLAKCVGAVALGVAVFWPTAENCGSESSEVVVHVSAEGVEVLVDHSRFWIAERLQHPIVCQLRPGMHELRMIRDGRVVYEEVFVVERGQDRILTAWDDPSQSVNDRLSDNLGHE
jgi:hypothetical protein